MKKIFLTSVITSVVILSSTAFGFSQSDNKEFAYQSAKIEDNIAKFISLDAASELSSNEVNVKAVKNFTKQFGTNNTAKWYQTSDAFVAGFVENGIETKAIYDLKGNWHSMLRTYSEDKMPFDVRDLVKSTYYDYNIMVVYEITHPDNVTYILKIEDSKKIKTLRVTDGNMEVIGDYKRG
jgi:hypothetical protein